MGLYLSVRSGLNRHPIMKTGFFSDRHPILGVLYYFSVMTFMVLLNHPLIILGGFFCSIIYAIYRQGLKTTIKNLWYLGPVLLLTALLNPLFVHQGVTILFYLPWGNPVTLQAVYYGLAAGAMLAGVMGWFSVFNKDIMADQFVYLGSGIVPAISMILAMTLRLVPMFNSRFKEVYATQKLLHPKRNKLQTASATVDVMMGWSLENAVVSADSMQARGYGLKHRSHYHKYRLTSSDILIIVLIGIIDAYLIYAGISGQLVYHYYPKMTGSTDIFAIVGIVAYLGLCLLPLAGSVIRELVWNN